MSSAAPAPDTAVLAAVLPPPGIGEAGGIAGSVGGASFSDSMPGLIDETQLGLMPEGLCLPRAGAVTAGYSELRDAAWKRLGEVDLAWCGTVACTAEYLGVGVLPLLAELAPLVPLDANLGEVGATWQAVHDVVSRCDNAQAECVAAATAASVARRTEEQGRHAIFAGAAASVLVQSIAARLCVALDTAGDATFESAYLDALFAAILDAVSFHDTMRGPWWVTFAPRTRAALDLASRRAGHNGFAALVGSIVGGGGLSCVHEWPWSGLAHPTAARDGRRTTEPAWLAPGLPGDYYEELHRLAHDSRRGAGAVSLIACDADVSRRGHRDHAAHLALLCSELHLHNAYVVSDAGAVSTARGASRSYLVENAGRLARQRLWCASVEDGWHVDDARPNAHADAAARGVIAFSALIPLVDHMPGHRAGVPTSGAESAPVSVD